MVLLLRRGQFRHRAFDCTLLQGAQRSTAVQSLGHRIEFRAAASDRSAEQECSIAAVVTTFYTAQRPGTYEL
jgi:hypothetical protein